MVIMKKYLSALVLIALAFTPLSKQEQNSPPRSAAIHDCNVEAAKYAFHVWQTEQFAVYGTCMAKRHQRFD
jgi:predicted outer membrane protein